MSRTLLRWLLRAALCTAAAAAQAQGGGTPTPVPTPAPTSARAPAPTPHADPADPRASVPALSYRSPFARYRGLDADSPTSWREANDAVAGAGGWRAYAREAHAPEPAASGPEAGASPKPGGHRMGSPQPMPMPPGNTGHTGHSGHSGHKPAGGKP